MSFVYSTAEEMKAWRRNQSGSVGFVPTMGALHAGHRSLLEKSLKENDKTVLSVFVNPTQFNDPKDYERYPVTFQTDLDLASQLGVDAVFAPQKSSMYPDNYRYRLSENDLSQKFCGAHRPGHFDGVLTVVMKLFHIVQPLRAYFGEKDFQQLRLIQNMVSAFFLDIEIIPVPTLRELSGLAMSSRNTLISSENRDKAPQLNQILNQPLSLQETKRALEKAGFKVDYVEDFEDRRLAAAFLGDVRLIDNVFRPSPQYPKGDIL